VAGHHQAEDQSVAGGPDRDGLTAPEEDQDFREDLQQAEAEVDGHQAEAEVAEGGHAPEAQEAAAGHRLEADQEEARQEAGDRH